jgi:uncharacterized protein YcaQ
VTLLVSPEAARRIVVDRQGFASRARSASVDEIEQAIIRLGCVQIDSVMTVDRAHRITLASRLGRLPADGINDLRRRGRVFEYWAHEASLLPIADYPLFHAMRARGEHPWWEGILTEHRAIADQVLADIAESGPSSARAYGGAGAGFWEWTPAKKVFEALWTAGELAVAERRGFERLYDLTERVIPAEHRRLVPSTEEVMRALVERAVRARGIVTVDRLADYYRVRGRRPLAVPIAELVAEGTLVACRVGEHDAVCDPAAAALVDSPPALAAPVLLCPFDNLVWDREEARRLFGFSHALEIYKPAPQRVWGYYVLPLLVGDRIVARVDLKSDRKAGVLRALRITWEGRPAPVQLDRAMARLAHALSLPEVAIEST